MSYIKLFNDNLVELLSSIREIYPENVELKMAEDGLNRLKSLNPKLIANQWYIYVTVPYGESILLGDIDHFIHKDYTEDLKDNKNAELVNTCIDNLRAPIKDLLKDEGNREFIVTYLKLLTQLSKEIVLV